MKKKNNKLIFVVIIGVVLIVSIFFIYNLFQSNIKTNSEDNLNENTPRCVNYGLKDMGNNFMDNSRHDCSNINGGTHQGEIEVDLDILNQNDIALSIPCKWNFSKTFFNSEPIHTIYETKDFTIFIGAQSSKTEKISTKFPDCYTGFDIICKDVEELPECS